MPKISFAKPIHGTIHATSGSVLMEALLAQKIPVASSCMGKGVCSKCRVQIVAGAENLSPESAFEKRIRERNRVPDGMRISCQGTVHGDVTIDAPYW